MEGVEGRGEEGALVATHFLAFGTKPVYVRTHSAAPQGGKRGRDTLKSVGIHPPPCGLRLQKKTVIHSQVPYFFKKNARQKTLFRQLPSA